MYVPLLTPPNLEKEFHIYFDAYNVAIGLVMSQKDEKDITIPYILLVINIYKLKESILSQNMKLWE